jgi:hypothetical protein
VPTGKLDGSIDASTLMSGFCRRSRLQEYHSLTDDWMVAGSPAVDACVVFSMRNVSAVGPQVLVWNADEPRKVL